MKDAAAIVGIGETPFAKALEDSEAKLAGTAILAALEDAGIEASEVDGLAFVKGEFPSGSLVMARVDGALPYDLLCTPVDRL